MLPLKFPHAEWTHRSLWCRTLIRQRSLSLPTSRANTIHANILDAVTENNRGCITARGLDVEVLELDVLAHSVRAGAAGQLGYRVPVLARAVAGEVLKENVGNVHSGRILGARLGGYVEVA